MKPEREAGMREELGRALLLDKYADMATDWADGATQINFHDFHGYDAWPDVCANIRKAMGLLYDEAYRAGAEAQRERDAQIAEDDACTTYPQEQGASRKALQLASDAGVRISNAIRSAPIEGEP